MRQRILMTVLGIVISAMMTASAFAEFVYVTQYGKKYHHAESRFIQDREGVEKITVEEAQERGLEPSKSYLKWKEAQAEGGKTAKSE